MPQNPTENNDPNIDLTRDDPASIHSPVPSGAQNHVRLDSDDLPEERIERLGQFLSDSTLGNITEDVKHPGKNFFPIDAGTQTQASTTVSDGESNQIRYTELIETAKQEFDELKNSSAFDGEFLPPLSDRPKGHYILEGGPAQNAIGGEDTEGAHSYVYTQIDNAGINSRWGGLGKPTISPDTMKKNPMLNSATGSTLKFTEPDMVKRTESIHSERKLYSHGGSIEVDANRNSPEFWDKYFDRMSRVGAAMTIKATGRDVSTYPNGNIEAAADRLLNNIGGASGNFDSFLEEEKLTGHWARKDMNDMYAGHAFFDGDTEQTLDADQMEKRFGQRKESHGGSVNDKSWGQSYSWDDPFEMEGIPGFETKALTAIAEMAQVYLFCAVRATAVGLLFGVARVIEGGKKRFSYANPDDPQLEHPTTLKKGSSRYNSILSEALIENHRERRAERAGEIIENGTSSLEITGRVIAQGIVDQALRTVNDEVVNIPRAILREIGLFIPRNYLTQLEDQFKSGDDVTGLALVGHALWISSAYLAATVSGLAELAGNLLLQDYGKSLGFWRSLFKEVTRSRAEFVTRRETESIWMAILKFLGKDDKCTGFMNYLAMLGDTTVGSGVSGPLNFPIMDVPLDYTFDFPTLRPSKYRDASGRSTTAVNATPSMMLIPSWVQNPSPENNLISHISGRPRGTFGAPFTDVKNKSAYGKFTDAEKELIERKYQNPTNNNRFSREQVIAMEDQLEAEYMPFYLQDLRTNEIISFHAFLTALSDSYTGEWSGQKGFGRLEPVQIYGGASRAIGVSFTMVATSKEDFDALWWKANKLVTMVYPQWSKGTVLKNGDNKFVQPFSQVMTASPLARLRVGDLFTSNYSKENMARMMGADDSENFAWADFEYEEAEGETVTFAKTDKLMDYLQNNGHATKAKNLRQKLKNGQQYTKIFIGSFVEQLDMVHVPFTVEEPAAPLGTNVINVFPKGTKQIPEGENAADPEVFFTTMTGISIVRLPEGSTGTPSADSLAFPTIFTDQNPIIKSFESNMGRGIAVAINSIGFEYKLGSFPWELEPGNRAPRWIDVTLGVIPIHDITPGLDHKGFNRAPVYKVGDYSKSISGDVHHPNVEYEKLIQNIKTGHKYALQGRAYDREGDEE